MAETRSSQEIQMNAADMYREDMFTDNAVGTLRQLTPVNAQGGVDPTRQLRFVGSTQVLTPAGPLPISFEIEARSLAEAIAAFGAAAREALQQTMEELRELQRQQASSIVVPRGGMPPSPMGGMGGGKIHIP